MQRSCSSRDRDHAGALCFLPSDDYARIYKEKVGVSEEVAARSLKLFTIEMGLDSKTV